MQEAYQNIGSRDACGRLPGGIPKVSVLMGTHNEKEGQAARAIDSVLSQTFRDFEFIICDDGSEEGFFRWLQGYCRKDPRILLLRNESNQGLAVTLNRCLRHASGAYIARMDADDVSKAGRLERQAAFLGSHPEYALVGSHAQLFDESGVWGIRRMEEMPGRESFLKTSPFIHPTVMLRREVMEGLHGYCERPGRLRVEDYDFFMRLYAVGHRGYNLQEALLAYREDGQSYRKRRIRYRVNECVVRCQGFCRLGILRGNLRYVVKPLAAGIVPGSLMAALRRRKYGRRKGRQRVAASLAGTRLWKWKHGRRKGRRRVAASLTEARLWKWRHGRRKGRRKVAASLAGIRLWKRKHGRCRERAGRDGRDCHIEL